MEPTDAKYAVLAAIETARTEGRAEPGFAASLVDLKTHRPSEFGQREENACSIANFGLPRFETSLEAFFFASGEAVVVADLVAFDHAFVV